ncbi:hypothetical protein Pelo_12841 [Pelomyxa schiedti]|nr:hypothetical protein Pelo_12841 [Pelomyxa schiedti]
MYMLGSTESTTPAKRTVAVTHRSPAPVATIDGRHKVYLEASLTTSGPTSLVVACTCPTTSPPSFRGALTASAGSSLLDSSFSDRDVEDAFAAIQAGKFELRQCAVSGVTSKPVSPRDTDLFCFRLCGMGFAIVLEPECQSDPTTEVLGLRLRVSLLEETVQALTAKIGMAGPRIAVVAEERPKGHSIGTTTINAWFVRKFTNVLFDSGINLSLQAGGVVIPKGKYYIKIRVPGIYCDRYTSRLDSSRQGIVGTGTSEFAQHASGYTQSASIICAAVSVDGTEELNVWQIVAQTHGNCLGVETNQNNVERYMLMEVTHLEG